MSRMVLLVDSLAKARTVQEQFGDELEVLVMETPPVRAVFQPPRDPLARQPLRFSFSPLPSANSFLEQLHGHLNQEIYLAFANDSRGEHWAWLLSEYLLALSKGGCCPRRIRPVSYNRDDIEAALRVVSPVRVEAAVAHQVRLLFNASFCRHLKRLLGTATGPAGLPLHGGSLTLLLLLAEREAEIQAYPQAMKWQVRVRLATGRGDFEGRLEEAYEISDEGVFRDAAEAKRAVDLLRDRPVVIDHLSRTGFSMAPPPLFRLAELLDEAYHCHQLQPGQVLAAVESLCEGVDFRGERLSLVAWYPEQEDGGAVPLLELIRQQVAALHGEQLVAEEEAATDLAGVFLPTRPALLPAEVASALSGEMARVYALIHGRALASQMREARGELVEVRLTAGRECLLTASLRTLVSPGFLAADPGVRYQSLVASSPLEGMDVGDQVEVAQIIPEQTSGFPPEYYTVQGLAADLAEFSLAMDSGTVRPLQALLQGGYASLMPDATWRCRENAHKLLAVLDRAFPTMRGIQLAAYLAQTVTEVVSSRKPLGFALQQFEQTMVMQGNVLAKVAVPRQVRRSRSRSSRSIIKGGGQPAAASPPAAPAAAQPPSSPAARGVAGGGVPEGAEPLAVEQGEAMGPAGGQAGEPEAVPGASEEALAAERGEDAGVVAAPAAATGAGEEGGPSAGQELESIALGEEEALDRDVALTGEEEGGQPAQEVFNEPLPPEAVAPDRSGEEAVLPAGEDREERTIADAGPTRNCPECGRPMLLKEDRFGRYWSCAGYPHCRHSESYGQEAGIGLSCPLCHQGNILSKHTPTGKTFYVCPEPDCEFMAWSRPVPVPCQLCGSPFLVEAKTLAGKPFLRCPRAGCAYRQPLAGEGVAAGGAAVSSAGKKRKVRVVRRAAGKGKGGKRLVRVVRKKKG